MGLPTHRVFNQPKPLENYNLFDGDTPLQEAIEREGGVWALERLRDFGARLGSAEVMRWGFEANENPPVLHTHDRYGHRVDEVCFHPAYHALMDLALKNEVHSFAWNRPDQKGAHVARLALHSMFNQVESSVTCPVTMTFAVYPALQVEASVAEVWGPRVLVADYDLRHIPAQEKRASTMGMAMTEKQGGSDVRANTTRAEASGDGSYRLTGHKWFCSAPMSDAFLTLAQAPKGLTCFLVPRFLPDGTKNHFFIQRLKDKLGNKANASSEIEYADTYALRVGPEGRGVPTIIEMVNHTRLDCISGSVGIMRQALVQALHHTSQRSAFGALLKDQPLMKNVLAHMALELEGATALMMRLARAYDAGEENPRERAFARLMTAVGKYYICKRTPALVFEAMECHGGAGYVEESVMPRLYREAPLSSIWEGSGNVMCLDVLRAMAKEPVSLDALKEELRWVQGHNAALDRSILWMMGLLEDPTSLQVNARRLVECLAVVMQARLLLEHAPEFVSGAYVDAFIGGNQSAYGTLPANTDFDGILVRAWRGLY